MCPRRDRARESGVGGVAGMSKNDIYDDLKFARKFADRWFGHREMSGYLKGVPRHPHSGRAMLESRPESSRSPGRIWVRTPRSPCVLDAVSERIGPLGVVLTVGVSELY